MKENTAMQELIRQLKNDLQEVYDSDNYSEDFADATSCAIFMAEQLLELEQEQIWDAHLAGENHDCDMEEGEIRDSRECGHYKYYQDTYHTDWEEKRRLFKEKQKERLIKMMRGDEELGLYDNEAKDL
jgi:hypothetical protein